MSYTKTQKNVVSCELRQDRYIFFISAQSKVKVQEYKSCSYELPCENPAKKQNAIVKLRVRHRDKLHGPARWPCIYLTDLKDYAKFLASTECFETLILLYPGAYLHVRLEAYLHDGGCLRRNFERS
jgi:hypothetical protein